MSDESGRFEVSVRTFPDPAGRSQISVEGGTEPVWSPDGRRLYYRAGNALLAVTVALDAAFRVLARDTVFADLSGYLGTRGTAPAAYDVHPDGERFVFLAREGDTADGDAMLTVVVNWFEELRERMGEASAAAPIR